MVIHDYIVVGSGCTGAIAAKTLVDLGARVVLLDVGVEAKKEADLSKTSFVKIRTEDEEQSDFFLGENFEALANLVKKSPSHLTPQRNFIHALVNEYLIWEENEFNPIESLAKGGLGNAWGLGSYVYSDAELMKAGLPVEKIKAAYRWISEWMSISGGGNDAASAYSNGELFPAEKGIPLDFNGAELEKKLSKNSEKLKQKGFYIGRAPLALSTEIPKNGKLYEENDLDFYSNGSSTIKTAAFRPNTLVEALQKTGKLSYHADILVLSFTNENGHVQLETWNQKTNAYESFVCKKLILATGPLGTARIVMRSTSTKKLPIICNAYTFIPSLQFPLIGAENTSYQTGLAQFSMYYDPDGKHENVAMGSVYSYRSLMGFRLSKEFPFDFKTSQQFLKLLLPALNITGLFHPEHPSETKYIELIPDENSIKKDRMKGTYQLTNEEKKVQLNTEKAFRSALRKMGTFPLQTKHTLHGTSIHYGGTLPFSSEISDTPSINQAGQLHGFSNVYVADGSGFTFLSGKGLTLSLMAFAHHVANSAYED